MALILLALQSLLVIHHLLNSAVPYFAFGHLVEVPEVYYTYRVG